MFVLKDLLKQMAEQKVKPNLLTLNAVLKSLRRCGALGKSQAFPVISEMKVLSIGELFFPVFTGIKCYMYIHFEIYLAI